MSETGGASAHHRMWEAGLFVESFQGIRCIFEAMNKEKCLDRWTNALRQDMPGDLDMSYFRKSYTYIFSSAAPASNAPASATRAQSYRLWKGPQRATTPLVLRPGCSVGERAATVGFFSLAVILSPLAAHGKPS